MTLTRQIKAGTTDVSVVIRIVDSSDGTPETGVVYNTSGIDLQYRREGAASTAITEATLAALTTAHTDGGFLHIGNGYYRLDLPDAAVAAGASGVLVHGTVTGMVVIGCYIELVAYDPTDTVRLGLTALPNAASGSSGAIITQGTGTAQLNVSSGAIAALAANVITATSIASNAITSAKIAASAIGASQVAADAIGASELAADAASEIATAVWAAVTRTLTANTNLNDPTAAAIRAEIDSNSTQLAAVLSRLPSSLVSGRMSSDVVALSGSTTAADNLEASALGIIVGAAQTGTLSTTVMTSNLSGYDNDRLIGRTIVFTGAPLAGEATDITDYASTSGTLTFTAVTEAPTNGTTFVIV